MVERKDTTTTTLRADDISVQRGKHRVLEDVHLELRPGELLGLVGPNGAGKSTLLSVLAGLEKPLNGEVRIGRDPILHLKDNERARKIGWMEQLSAPHWPVTVEHLVMLGRIPYLSRWQTPGDRDHQLVSNALRATDCAALAGRRVDTLSGGELTRVMLARVLATEPAVLLADEPIAALDIGHQLQVLEVLRRFASKKRSCVVVLHDLSLASRYCDRLVLLHEGKHVATGLPANVLTTDTVRRVYGVETEPSGPDGSMLYPIRRSDSHCG